MIVCVYVRERERERECVCVRERGRVNECRAVCVYGDMMQRLTHSFSLSLHNLHTLCGDNDV